MAADVDSDFDVGQFWAILEAALTRLQLCALCIVVRNISLPEVLNASAGTVAVPSPNVVEQAVVLRHASEHTDGDIVHPLVSPCPCSQCLEAARRASLTLAERSLEDFDADAFVARLSAAIPTFQRAIVPVGRPSRWGGCLPGRTVHLGRTDGLMSEMCAEEYVDHFCDSLVRSGMMMPLQSFAALARRWYHGARA